MSLINLSKYGPILSDKQMGDDILSIINKELKDNESIEIDLNGVLSMATYCAKQIFGNLYVKLGPEAFFDKIKIINASNDIKVLIRIGIQNALEEK